MKTRWLLGLTMAVIFPVLLTATPGCASGGDAPASEAALVLEGTVRVVGSEPFTRLVLTVRQKAGQSAAAATVENYLLDGPLTETLRKNYQMRKVTLAGVACVSTVPDYKNCFKPTAIIKSGKAGPVL